MTALSTRRRGCSIFNCIKYTQGMSENFTPRELAAMQTNEALQSPGGANRFEDNLTAYGLEQEDLAGVTLDIGTSTGDVFAREAKRRGIEVVSMDPVFLDSFDRAEGNAVYNLEPIEKGGQWVELDPSDKKVAGIVQHLPFADEAFDRVVSHAAFPVYVPSTDYPDSLKEVSRVLKPGGVAIFAPVPDMDFGVFNLEAFKKAVEESGFEFSYSTYKQPWGNNPELSRVTLTKSSTTNSATRAEHNMG